MLSLSITVQKSIYFKKVCFLKVNHARKTYINCKVPPYRTPHTRTQMVFVLTASNWTSQTIVASWSCMIWHWWSRINNCTWNVYVTNVWLNYNLFYNVFVFTWCKVQNFLQNVQLQKFCKKSAKKLQIFCNNFLQLFCNFFATFLQFFCKFFAKNVQKFLKKRKELEVMNLSFNSLF